MARSRWILGSFGADGAAILFPGALALPLAWALSDTPLFVGLTLLALVAVDSGHAYSTVWRTYFRSEERRSSAVYWAVPLGIVAVMTAWFASGIPHAWKFVLYLTMFHHFRQYYGMLRWYERLNARTCRASGLFLYGLAILPFALLHVRPEPRLSLITYYSAENLFIADAPAVWSAGLKVYAALWCAWLAFEARLWARGVREPNRLLAVFAPSALAAYCFLYGTDVATLVLPMVFNHGVPYYAVLSLSLNRLDPERYRTLAWTVLLIVASGAVFGAVANMLSILTLSLPRDYTVQPVRLWEAAALAAYLIPRFGHYLLDAYIWTGRHREAKVVYGLSTARS